MTDLDRQIKPDLQIKDLWKLILCINSLLIGLTWIKTELWNTNPNWFAHCMRIHHCSVFSFWIQEDINLFGQYISAACRPTKSVIYKDIVLYIINQILVKGRNDDLMLWYISSRWKKKPMGQSILVRKSLSTNKCPWTTSLTWKRLM